MGSDFRSGDQHREQPGDNSDDDHPHNSRKDVAQVGISQGRQVIIGQRCGPQSGQVGHPLRNEGKSQAGELLRAPFPPGGAGRQQAKRDHHDQNRQPDPQGTPFCKPA